MGFKLSKPYSSLYDEFLEYEKSRVSKQGFDTIKKNVLLVFKWFESENILLSEASVQDALAFRQAENERVKKDGKPLSAGTVINRLKAAKSLFSYLLGSEKIKSNPFAEIDNPRSPDYLSRNVLTEAQMGRLLDELAKFDTIENERLMLRRYRVHVIAECLYASGLRITEAALITEKNIDMAQRLIYVKDGKWNKSRMAFLTGYAADVLKIYFSKTRSKVLGTYQRGCENTAFGTHPQRLMAVVNSELKDVCKKLELPEISSHGFRYSLGTHLLRKGCDMRYIQVILGHESLATTQVYTRVNTDEVKKTIDDFHPRSDVDKVDKNKNE
ncbi:MAG: site-specific tyrosine recombinase XerD [Termitinemataceae bacterium]|nr:MAG: site-specific tyrosine recombinase XerD [Termitinemataceae bacterium]